MLAALSRPLVRGQAVRLLRPAAFTSIRFNSDPAHHAHEVESFEAFNKRYETFFTTCGDLFELQRGLNNCFAYDLVPTTEVITAALKCARKVNDYATAVRILEGLRTKVENKGQYIAYIDELKPVMEELGKSSSPSFSTIAGISLLDRGCPSG